MTDDHHDDSATGRAASLGDLPVRLIVVLALVVVGLGLAGVGAVLGLGGTLADTGENPEIAVSGENITVVTPGRDSRTVLDMTDVTEVEITVTDDEFRVQVERANRGEAGNATPLSDHDHERATAIVRENETVMSTLGGFEDHEVSVRPADELDESFETQAEPNRTAPPDIEGATNQTTNESIDLYLADESGDSVTIRRRSTDEGQVVVVTLTTGTQRQSVVIDSPHPSTQGPHAHKGVTRYSLVVDLEDQQVLELRPGPDG